MDGGWETYSRGWGSRWGSVEGGTARVFWMHRGDDLGLVSSSSAWSAYLRPFQFQFLTMTRRSPLTGCAVAARFVWLLLAAAAAHAGVDWSDTIQRDPNEIDHKTLSLAARSAQPSYAIECADRTCASRDQYRVVAATEAVASPATGTYHDAINTTGWSVLSVSTSSTFPATKQAYGAGYLEGYLSQERISQSFTNTIPHPSEQSPWIRTFAAANLQWTKDQTAKNHSEYWKQVSYIVEQVEGLYDGYMARLKERQANQPTPTPDQGAGTYREIVLEEMWHAQISGGDLDTLQNIDPTQPHDRLLQSRGQHCSGLAKFLADNGQGQADIFFSHASWDMYDGLIRVYKHYDFPFVANTAQNATFASYPGLVLSSDDFYVLSNGLALLTTEMGALPNTTLYEYLLEKEAPTYGLWAFFRSTVANRLADTADQWVDIFSQNNLGTLENQWLIVDYNKLAAYNQAWKTAGTRPSALPEYTMVVFEQALNYKLWWADKSAEIVANGYIPSLNMPSNMEMFEVSGFPPWENRYGGWYGYSTSARYIIFNRDQHKVKDLTSAMAMIRYADLSVNPNTGFPNDPAAASNSTPPWDGSNTVCARMDLDPTNGVYPYNPPLGFACFGGYDGKVVNAALVAERRVLAISGPTYYNGNPVFQYSTGPCKSFGADLVGLPDRWDFPWLDLEF